ncbi:DUF362 domain-containing protein [Sphaerobacter sp.]|uniref:DUF362 domain-containing protein n=1 Tax=Sphaerobacter sp. TaxID=2099654 RepID=UPI001D704BD4|nr:DUF362 domain-containing protein [Sphaerobacter sp.]MBX5446151.1 DUF362 domain-containing protein [Sphaerobacter sp.]
MRILRSRRAAGLTMALGATGATILAARRIIPAAEMLLSDAGPSVPLPAPKANAYVDESGRSLVAVTTARDPAEGVRRAIAVLGGLERLTIAGQRVLIKPSAASGIPAPASTSPGALEAVIQLVQDHGAREVLVGEMAGPPWHDTTVRTFRSGLLDVIENNGAHFVDFRYDRWVTVPLGDRARIMKRVTIPRSVYEADVIIGLPVLPPHRREWVAPGLALWPGVVHPRTQVAARAARDRSRAVAEINLAFQPDLLVLDASSVWGEAAPGGLVLASGDRIALDVCAMAVLAALDHRPIQRGAGSWEEVYIQAAVAVGLGTPQPGRVKLVPDPDRAGDPLLARWLDDIQRRTGVTAG